MIDIIIPMYNARETIERALNSIAVQSCNDNIKVYLIDDVSDDSYMDIIEKYQEKLDIRFHRLDEHHGPGYARNYGLKMSHGEYVVFIDADDELEVDAVDTLHKEIIKQNGDIVRASILEVGFNGTRVVKNWNISLHGKIYRKKFIEDNNIYFLESFSNEDMAFNMALRLCGAKMTDVDNIVYRWYFNKNSVYRRNAYESRMRDFYDITNNTLKVLEDAEARGCNEELVQLISLEQLIQIFIRWIYIDKSRIEKEILYSIKRICDIYIKHNKKEMDELIYKYNLVQDYNDYKRNTFYNFLREMSPNFTNDILITN